MLKAIMRNAPMRQADRDAGGRAAAAVTCGLPRRVNAALPGSSSAAGELFVAIVGGSDAR
jgi:hypothetical protein